MTPNYENYSKHDLIFKNLGFPVSISRNISESYMAALFLMSKKQIVDYRSRSSQSAAPYSFATEVTNGKIKMTAWTYDKPSVVALGNNLIEATARVESKLKDL